MIRFPLENKNPITSVTTQRVLNKEMGEVTKKKRMRLAPLIKTRLIKVR